LNARHSRSFVQQRMSCDPRFQRSCGVCCFGKHPTAVPSAAAVLAYGCTTFSGAEGIIAYIAQASAREQMHSASAYCEACREVTWLCTGGADGDRDSRLNNAVVEFKCNVQRTRAVEAAVEIVHSSNRV
jgi:hypothetical protein